MVGHVSAEISFSPLLPWGFAVIAGVVLLAMCLRILAQPRRGGVLRICGFAVLILAVMNPHYEQEKRESQNDVALVLVDHSPSQLIGNRKMQRREALESLRERLASHESLDVRVVEFGGVSVSGNADDGTLLGQALVAATAGIPEDRYAGAIVITDGQVHDLEDQLDNNPVPRGPLHALLTGDENSFDRRVTISKAPGYGLVGQESSVEFRVSETRPQGTRRKPIAVTLTVNGQDRASQAVLPDEDVVFSFVLDHAGVSVIEVVAENAEGELSALNNSGVVTINGVRDRLRVLLISGQPHAGERTWRNLLKSDPAVDLVHFTILRPPEKSDFTPIQELALIAFPTFELFDIKIDEFDLMIFDRYVVRHVLSPRYYRNIEKYVLGGGGLLVVVGPEYAGSRSLNETAIGEMLPVSPTGDVIEQGYYPRLSDLGRRHPVTAPLADRAGDPEQKPSWGRWFRLVESHSPSGSVLMNGVNDQPLLLLDKHGEGRIGMMTSDHIWLWARGYEGGGPQAELLRRLAHWLMKEPSLEEELLEAKVVDRELHIMRRSMDELPGQVTVTKPNGATEDIELVDTGAGQATAVYAADLPGAYRIQDGTLSTLAAAGDLNPLEYNDLTASSEPMLPYVESSGGGIWWLNDIMPEVRRTKPDRDQAGRDWLGLQANGSYVVTGLERISIFPIWLAAILSSGFLLGAWWREGR